MSTRCVNKSSQGTPGHWGIIDFGGGRISFQFGSTRNHTKAAALCMLMHILDLVADISQIGLGVQFWRYLVSTNFLDKLTGKTIAVLA